MFVAAGRGDGAQHAVKGRASVRSLGRHGLQRVHAVQVHVQEVAPVLGRDLDQTLHHLQATKKRKFIIFLS